MRYIIYGAGAVGGTIGARLFESGADIVFIARGAHGRAIRETGLRFGTPEGWRTLPVRCVEEPAALTFGDGDAVILTVKSQDTDGALNALVAAGAPADLPIVCAQNGVENERRALRRFAAVHGMLVLMGSVHLEPGSVHAHLSPQSGVVDLGRYPSGSDDLDARIAGDLTAAMLISRVRDDIMARKYGKLLFNIGNVLEAAAGRGALGSALMDRARDEALAVYRAAGIAWERGAEGTDLASRPVPGVERGGGSTWQSVARGAPSLEADDLNGEIVLLGRLHGVPTPVNALFQALARRLVRERLAPGSLALDELGDA